MCTCISVSLIGNAHTMQSICCRSLTPMGMGGSPTKNSVRPWRPKKYTLSKWEWCEVGWKPKKKKDMFRLLLGSPADWVLLLIPDLQCPWPPYLQILLTVGTWDDLDSCHWPWHVSNAFETLDWMIRLVWSNCPSSACHCSLPLMKRYESKTFVLLYLVILFIWFMPVFILLFLCLLYLSLIVSLFIYLFF